jgi:hypothetical protein
MRRTPTIRRGLAALVAVLLLAPLAHAKAPGRSDPDKLAARVDKAADAGRWSEVVEGCARGLDLVAKGGDWDQRYGAELGIEVRLAWEKVVRGHAVALAERGDEERDRELQRQALALADMYLARWPDHTHSYELTYLQGELAFAVKEYRAAADAYGRLYAVNPVSGRLRHEAAAGWISALWADGGDNWEFYDGQADLVRQERLDLTDVIARRQPIELADGELEFIAAMDAFVSAVPDHKRSPALLYRTIWLHHDRYQARDGIPRCIAYLQGFSDGGQADHVAGMLIDLATWSERIEETQLRIRAMGLSWDTLEEQHSRAMGDPPRPWQPDRLDLFPRQIP